MGCPFSWKGYVGMWFATLVGCRIDIIKAQATEKREMDMLHTLEKGEYPKGHRYWSNATVTSTPPWKTSRATQARAGRVVVGRVRGGVLPCRVEWAVLRPALRHV